VGATIATRIVDAKATKQKKSKIQSPWFFMQLHHQHNQCIVVRAMPD
jgi:hypothetical protein